MPVLSRKINSFHKKNMSFHRFTMVELVAATAIMMMVSTIIAFASHSFFKALSSAELATEKLKTRLAIDQVMDTCFRNMIPFNWEYDDETDDTNQVFMGESNYIHFTTLRRSYDEDSGNLFFIRIYVDNDSQLIAEYSKYPRLPWMDDTDDMPYEMEVLATNVDTVSFLYAGVYEDNETVLWREYWNREDYNFIPHAVQMTVKWNDGTEECWLRRTTAAGGNSVYGGLQTIDE